MIHASRPSLQGLELHLLTLHKLIAEFKPAMVIVDPISSLITVGSTSEVRGMLVRLIDLLKTKNINAVFTSLTQQLSNAYNDATIDAVSSLADIWINLKFEENQGTRHRELLIVKARGMGHYENICNFTISAKGMQLPKIEIERVKQ
jgi:circadian clock protein KaiC